MSKRIWTPEQIERKRQQEKAKRDAKALAEGRVPGHVGRPKMELTAEERAARWERRKEQLKAWRLQNLDKAREIGRRAEKKRRDEQALAEGRIPGKKGPPKRFTEEELRAKRKAKTELHNIRHSAEYLEKARLRQQAKRDGTFVSRALPRLTPEQKRLRELVASAKRRGLLRNAFGKPTVEDIERLYELQEGICTFCNKPLGEDIHVDHWVPLSKGGSNDRLNLRLLHEKCNLVKGARHPSEFPLLQPTVLVWP